MKQKSRLRRLSILATLLGVLAGLTMAFLPLVRNFVSPKISVMILTVGVILFLLSMFMVVLSMLLNPQLIMKLAVLPVVYVLGMTGYIIYKLNVYVTFQMMLGVEIPNGEALLPTATDIGPTMMLLHGGVWITCLPLIIVAIYKFVKINKATTVDVSTFDTGRAVIKTVEDTYTTINRHRVYNIGLSIPYYLGESYEVKKEARVPMHIIHTLTIGSEVAIFINPKKREDVYIQTDYGVL